eukprot:TRINITY_DN9484_c0_g1_i2.p1 TRINITY_DN9484_c0_g1~~TRINITY_DN9484_c0_g1_i2.p1  ORF type:complete len:263 (-),score=18.99 TRINITY_DN9484_c0_g1_i2:36-824(-)
MRIEIQKLGVSVHQSTIHKTLVSASINLKAVLPIPLNWNKPETIAQRRLYVTEQLTQYVLSHELYWVDESHFNLRQTRKRGRATASTTPTITVAQQKKSLSLLFCISKSGPVFWQFVESTAVKRGVTAQDIQSFLIALSAKLSTTSKSCLILDNAKIHHAHSTNQVLSMIKTSYSMDHLFLPPYSPFLNPIEYAFSKLKAKVGEQKNLTVDQLKVHILETISEITAEDCQAWIRHTARYHRQCSLGLPFTGKALSPTLLPES